MERSSMKRIILWSVPRSLSSAFFRSMLNMTGVKAYLEPHLKAYYNGPERVSTRYAHEPVLENYSYSDIKSMLEADQPDSTTCVFVKDMAYYFVNRLDSFKHLPKGFTHTFIVRNPAKTVPSLYALSLDRETTGWDYFDENEVGFKELAQMFKLVTEDLEQEVIVVDADDLLQDPEDVLRQYCRRVGIEFEDQMINWNEPPQDMQIFDEFSPWFKTLLSSNSFKPPPAATQKNTQATQEPELPELIKNCIEENMKYYQILHAHRIIPKGPRV